MSEKEGTAGVDLDALEDQWSKIGPLPTDEYSPDIELEAVIAAVPDLIAELRAARAVVAAARKAPRLKASLGDQDREAYAAAAAAQAALHERVAEYDRLTGERQ